MKRFTRNMKCPYNINFMKTGKIKLKICHLYTLIFSEIRIHIKCELSTVNTTYIYMQKKSRFQIELSLQIYV